MASINTAITNATNVVHCHGCKATPSKIPTAGGCSVFVIAIIKIIRPTDSPRHISDSQGMVAKYSLIGLLRINAENNAPRAMPIKCPPINDR